jgi:mannosyltransferase
MFGRTVGLVAGFLLALNAFIVQYAQTARSYSLLVLLVTLSSYFLVVELESPSKGNRIAYVLTCSLAVHAHYFAAYILLVHLGTVVVMRRRAAFRRKWLGVATAILLLCTPEAIIAYRDNADRIGWVQPPSLIDIEPLLVSLAGGSQPLLLALLAGGCYAMVSAFRGRRYWSNAFVTAWLVVPVVLSFTATSIQPMFVSRYLIICVPALLLFGTAAFAKLHHRAAIGALVAPLVLLSAFYLYAYYRDDRFEDWRDATRFVLAATHPGDAIVFYPSYAHKPFELLSASKRDRWTDESHGALDCREAADLACDQRDRRRGPFSGNPPASIVTD